MIDWLTGLPQAVQNVALTVGPASYDATAPFSPGAAYPEYRFAASAGTCGANLAYDAVRESLRLLGLDADRFGRSDWNPLAGIVKPGDTVVLKPNFVREFRETQPGDGDCLITHGSVIRAALDYVMLALAGTGRVIIADAPQNDACFEAIVSLAGLNEIREFYRRQAGVDVEVLDMRPEKARKVNGVIVGHTRLAGDPAGYVKVNMGERSAFTPVNGLCHLLYGSEYDTRELRRHHRNGLHEYLICKSVLNADCIIALPKLKTHKKTGITVNLKNLVGINGNKNWLPHHREGTPCEGGDQFADDRLIRRIERRMVACFKRLFPLLGPLRMALAGPIKAAGSLAFGDTNIDTIRSGNWYGNDTTWRMVLDLNRIALYADAAGELQRCPVRRFFSIVDGIVAGQGNGPLDATAKPAGMILAGFNPAAVDLVCARLMGFDYHRLPMLVGALADHELSLADFKPDEIAVSSNESRFHRRLGRFEGKMLAFEPHFGWRGHI
ncbi:MAG: DUF362 domain-containing protein [Planctomycetes bacterium]|nr:DUF362 domain-containing protein [Planctomycetota bacterium]